MTESVFFTSEDCEIIARKYLKSDKVLLINYETVPLTKKKILVNIAVEHESKQKILKFFGNASIESLKVNQLFDAFEKTLPEFNQEITPKLYYNTKDVAFFEELTCQDFKTCDPKSESLTMEHLKVVLKASAKFHAASFAYEEIKSKEIKSRYKLDQENKLKLYNLDLKASEVESLILSVLGNSNKTELLKILDFLNERQLSNSFKRTLCHGNLISKNILFKYRTDIPVECKLINFCSIPYLPPLYDVLQLIFLNTNEDFRQNNYEFLLFYYHNCLQEELEKYTLKVDDILPYEDLRLEAHFCLPLNKLEAALKANTEVTVHELREILDCSIVSREDCYAIARNKIGHNDYKFISFVVTPLDQIKGFLGNYHKLELKIFHKSEEIINCFIKCMPRTSTPYSIVRETGCFFKEIFIYQTLVPQMQKLEIHTIDDCLSNCYFQRSEELIVFDDISFKNFSSLKAQTPFDLSLLVLTIKKLAKFHASTIVFEEKLSTDRTYRLNEEYGKYLEESFFLKKDHAGSILMQTGIRSILDVINIFPELTNEKNQNNFKKCWPKLQEIFFTATHPSKFYRNVLNHGDLWTNNIMVQFEGAKPVDCRFVDYQCIRYCPPAHDYLSVLHLTTNRATRIKNEEELKVIYHKELGKILATYHYNVNKILPFEDFTSSIDYMRPQMIMQSIMYFGFCMCTSEEIYSFLISDEVCRYVFFEDRKEYLTTICKKSPAVKTKLMECILDLYDLCEVMSSNI